MSISFRNGISTIESVSVINPVGGILGFIFLTSYPEFSEMLCTCIYKHARTHTCMLVFLHVLHALSLTV